MGYVVVRDQWRRRMVASHTRALNGIMHHTMHIERTQLTLPERQIANANGKSWWCLKVVHMWLMNKPFKINHFTCSSTKWSWAKDLTKEDDSVDVFKEISAWV